MNSVYFNYPIKNRLENVIRRFWGQRGYWKQRIAMYLSRELGSLKEAWRMVNLMIKGINDAMNPERNYVINTNADLSHHYDDTTRYYGD